MDSRAQVSWWVWLILALALGGILLWFLAKSGVGIVDFVRGVGT